MVVRLIIANFKPLTFFVLCFSFSDVASICIFVILYDLCLLPAQFHYAVINIQYLESHVQLALEIYQWCGEPCFAGWASAANSQAVKP
jgi:hypothetical protein